MSGSLLIFLGAVLVIALLLIVLINFLRKAPSKLDVERYRIKWLEIERSLDKATPASWILCILNADKLVDQALKDRAIKGETMGERMKTARTIWSHEDSLWQAHKVRNRIAHESDANITYQQARVSLSSFKQALKDLGAI